MKFIPTFSLCFCLLQVGFAQTLFIPNGTVGTSSNNKVGIGISNPSFELDLNGRMRISSTGSINPVYLMAYDNTNKFQLGYDSSVDIFRIDSRVNVGGWFTRFAINKETGYVGIGNSNPTAPLDVLQEVSNVQASIFKFASTTLSSSNTYGIQLVNSDQSQGSVGGIKFSLFDDGAAARNAAWIAAGKEELWESGNSSTFKSFLVFGTRRGPSGGITEAMRINSEGNIGIGTISTGSHKLAVEGSIGAREIKVEANGWSDFVFYDEYELRTLEEVEEHIVEKGHLPEIPSEAEVTKNGINLGEMDAKLLQKIEELTLYLIQQNKQVQVQQSEISELRKEIERLKSN